jgi:hypothetical protein
LLNPAQFGAGAFFWFFSASTTRAAKPAAFGAPGPGVKWPPRAAPRPRPGIVASGFSGPRPGIMASGFCARGPRLFAFSAFLWRAGAGALGPFLSLFGALGGFGAPGGFFFTPQKIFLRGRREKFFSCRGPKKQKKICGFEKKMTKNEIFFVLFQPRKAQRRKQGAKFCRKAEKMAAFHSRWSPG